MLPERLRELLGSEGEFVTVIERSVEQQASAALTEIAGRAPWLRLVVGHCAGRLPCPRTRVEGSWPHGEIEFLGPLAGSSLVVFVGLLRALALRQPGFDASTPEILSSLSRNVAVSVHIAAGGQAGTKGAAHGGAEVAAVAVRLALASTRVQVTVIGRSMGGDAPEVLVDGHRIPGPWSERSLVEQCLIACEGHMMAPRSRS